MGSDELQRRWGGGISDAGLSGAGSLSGEEGGADSSPSDASHPFSVGEERRYEEVAELGQGGMGRVVLAVDRRLQRQVALKHIAVDLRDRPAAVRRFAREAFITASLDHPAIVPIFDAGGQSGGDLFYAMRLIRGRTLGQALRSEPDLRRRLALLRHFLVACEAVAFAHSRGVVHSDLKPDNILVGEFGETQVVDWGVARRLDEAQGEGTSDLDNPAGPPRGVVGTPGYMSPEQAGGAPPDPRSDVYSLGVVLYEIVTGRSMVEADTAHTVAAESASPSSGVLPMAPESTPPELATIIRHALARRPEDRYADARALAADVERFLDGVRVTVHRYSALEALSLFVRQHRAPFAVAAVAAVLLASLGVWALVRTRRERDRAVGAERQALESLQRSREALARSLAEQAMSAMQRGAQAEAEVLAGSALALDELPEARGVLAAFGFAGRPRLRERVELPRCDRARPRDDGAVLCLREGEVSLWQGRPLRATWRHALGASTVGWVAGGRWVMAAKPATALWLIDPGRQGSGAVSTPFSAKAGWLQPLEGGDSRTAFAGAGSSMFVINVVDSSMREQVGCPTVDGNASATSDGQHLVFACKDGSVRVLASADGRVERQVQTEFTGPRGELARAALHPSTDELVVSSMAGDLVRLDARSGAVLARRFLGTVVARTLVHSPDGRRLAVAGERGGVTVVDAGTLAVLHRLPSDGDGEQVPVWASSPPGAPAPAVLITVGSALRTWELPAAGRALSLMDAHPPGLAGADLSPDGTRLATFAGDGSVTVLDTRDGRRLLQDRFQRGVLKGGRFDAAGLYAWGTQSPSLRTWDAALRVVTTADFGGLKRAARLPSGWLVLARYAHGPPLMAPGEVVRSVDEGPEDAPAYLDLDGDDSGARVLLSDNHDDIWEATDGNPPRLERRASRPGLRAVALSGDGRRVALLAAHAVEILDRETLSPLGRVEVADSPIDDVALSADGALLAVGSIDRQARVYSTEDGRLRAVLSGHEARVAKVTFGRGALRHLLTTASWDGSARVWDLSSLRKEGEALRREAEAAWGIDRDQASAAALR